MADKVDANPPPTDHPTAPPPHHPPTPNPIPTRWAMWTGARATRVVWVVHLGFSMVLGHLFHTNRPSDSVSLTSSESCGGHLVRSFGHGLSSWASIPLTSLANRSPLYQSTTIRFDRTGGWRRTHRPPRASAQEPCQLGSE